MCRVVEHAMMLRYKCDTVIVDILINTFKVNRGLDNWQCSVGLNLDTTVVLPATRVVSIIDKQGDVYAHA